MSSHTGLLARISVSTLEEAATEWRGPGLSRVCPGLLPTVYASSSSVVRTNSLFTAFPGLSASVIPRGPSLLILICGFSQKSLVIYLALLPCHSASGL